MTTIELSIQLHSVLILNNFSGCLQSCIYLFYIIFNAYLFESNMRMNFGNETHAVLISFACYTCSMQLVNLLGVKKVERWRVSVPASPGEPLGSTRSRCSCGRSVCEFKAKGIFYLFIYFMISQSGWSLIILAVVPDFFFFQEKFSKSCFPSKLAD